MARLRGPDGCPWDRKQDSRSLRRYLLEECYEVADAIDRGRTDDLCEELGDLLLQIVFLARIAEEEGLFDVGDVARGIGDKLVRRHPHVFGDARADTAEEVATAWEEIKRREKREKGATDAASSTLDGIPAALPPLAKARLLGERAAGAGFDWPAIEPVFDKLREETDELRRALAAEGPAEVEAELGDLLFSVVNLARHCGADPSAALEAANRKFAARFRRVEKSGELGRADLERLERLWDEAKRAEAQEISKRPRRRNRS